jgi:hypothetical protein
MAPAGSVTVPTSSPVVAFCALAGWETPASNAQRHKTGTDTPIHRLKKFKLHLFQILFTENSVVEKHLTPPPRWANDQSTRKTPAILSPLCKFLLFSLH